MVFYDLWQKLYDCSVIQPCRSDVPAIGSTHRVPTQVIILWSLSRQAIVGPVPHRSVGVDLTCHNVRWE